MAPYDQFAIVLDDEDTFYHPGDEVKGRIFLKLSKSMMIVRIVVGFHGEGRVKYNDEYFIQPYFHDHAVVYDCNNENVHHQLQGSFPPGDFWFPFAFRLPPVKIQSSYLDLTGAVCYWLDAVIERSIWPNEETTIPIFVLELVDVNSPEVQRPRIKQKEMPISCCFVKGGKVNISGKINKGGYYPGDVIECKFFIENESNREVTYTEAIFKQKVTQQYPRRIFFVKHETAMEIASSRGIGKKMIAHVKGECVYAANIEIPIKIGFISSASIGSILSREVILAFALLVNSQMKQERQSAREGQEMGAGNHVHHDDQQMLLTPGHV
ncbi:thioredoxin-interacting protein-like [Actinia tenebrosa]|uniref:Thioredoxin-interacting protein-like n=1 Tax=Actinia tenebrosa TaxID=6105 RepID=A0A6P8HR96_ACTTE|nr:thioredoxin-interacting protein-like [Actinia tenebrosa]